VQYQQKKQKEKDKPFSFFAKNSMYRPEAKLFQFKDKEGKEIGRTVY
jgi:hypothetical protein